ncbi:MAG: hypothetical protein Kow0022_10570 [Phycisphaerales bacterium]
MRTLAIVTLAWTLALGTSTRAQDALGDGRGLENSLSATSSRNYQRPSLANEIRFRNAIATGNAPGGLSFRGDLGYTAPGDFRGQLGSDDLFAFRRDSLYSGLAGMGIRGTDALQFQFAMTTGARPPQNLVGSLICDRGFSGGVTTGRLPEGLQPNTPIQRSPEPFEPEGGTMLWTLRAPSAYESNRSYQPTLLATSDPNAETVYGVTASELRGVRRTELAQPPSNRINTALEPMRIETSFLRLQEQLRERAAEAEAAAAPPTATDTRPAWEQRLEELRNQILAPPPAETPSAEGQAGDRLKLHADPETLRMLKGGDGEPMANFVPPDADGVYAEHMKVGQSLIAAERYFDAEERFTQALTIRPGDVDAQVARVHAQIGAGMYLSAAVNLRTLLLDHPELVSVRYAANLLPSVTRIGEVAADFRAAAEAVRVENPTLAAIRRARAAGLLMVYLGYQTNDRALFEEGLEAARAAIARVYGQAPSEEDAREARLLDLVEQTQGSVLRHE